MLSVSTDKAPVDPAAWGPRGSLGSQTYRIPEVTVACIGFFLLDEGVTLLIITGGSTYRVAWGPQLPSPSGGEDPDRLSEPLGG